MIKEIEQIKELRGKTGPDKTLEVALAALIAKVFTSYGLTATTSRNAEVSELSLFAKTVKAVFSILRTEQTWEYAVQNHREINIEKLEGILSVSKDV